MEKSGAWGRKRGWEKKAGPEEEAGLGRKAGPREKWGKIKEPLLLVNKRINLSFFILIKAIR